MSVKMAEVAHTKNGICRDSLPKTTISGEDTVRKAKNYLTKYVSFHFGGAEPILLDNGSPIWQVLVSFKGMVQIRLTLAQP